MLIILLQFNININNRLQKKILYYRFIWRWFVKHCFKRELNISWKFSRINISLKNDVRELSIILYKAQSWFNEEMYKLRWRIPSIFETNSAKFLIAGPNFGKITSLHGYCPGILRVLVRALARLKTVSMRQIYSELCTHMTAILEQSSICAKIYRLFYVRVHLITKYVFQNWNKSIAEYFYAAFSCDLFNRLTLK